MIKKVVLLTTLCTLLSGCFMAPMALIGPAASGFTTASIIQSGLTSGTNYIVKKSTGKSITQHAFDAISSEVLQQTYVPERLDNIKSKKNFHNIITQYY